MVDPMKQIVADIKSDEGWVPHVYDDHLGFATIGWGFLVDKRRGGGMPEEVGDYWLDLILDRLWERLSDRLPWFDDAPAGVQRALVNMSYQLGVTGLLGFRKTLALLEQGRWAEAADQALQSRWAQQTPARAKRVTDWIRNA